MAYVEKYEWTRVYTWKSLGLVAYGFLDTVFMKLFKSGGGEGAQGQRDNH